MTVEEEATLFDELHRHKRTAPSSAIPAAVAMAKKKSPRRNNNNAAGRRGGRPAVDGTNDEGSPSRVPVADADADVDADADAGSEAVADADAGSEAVADADAGAEAVAVDAQKEPTPGSEPADGVGINESSSSEEPASRPLTDSSVDASNGPAERAAAKMGAGSGAEDADQRQAPNTTHTPEAPGRGVSITDTEQAITAKMAPTPIEHPQRSDLVEHIEKHETPSFAEMAKSLAASDAEEKAIRAAAAAEEVPKLVEHPPESELVQHIKHHEASSFADVAKQLAVIDAEDKAIDGAAAAKQVPKPVQHPPESELVEYIKHNEAPSFVDAAKHSIQNEEAEKKAADEPVLKSEEFPTLAEVEPAAAAHESQNNVEEEEDEDLVQKIVHHRAPSFADIAKHPAHEAEHAEEAGSEREKTEEKMAPAAPRKHEADEDSTDVFLSALELEQQHLQQQYIQQQHLQQQHIKQQHIKQQQDPATMIADAAIPAAAKIVEAAVSNSLNVNIAPKSRPAAHEEKEIFVAEARRLSAGNDPCTSPSEVAKRKKAARLSLFVSAGAFTAAALAVLGLSTKYRMRKGPAAGIGTVVGVVVGFIGWMYGRKRT